jgi:hypothetical protein
VRDADVFRFSKVELEFLRIEPTCLYGLDDRIPKHFLDPHELQRNCAEGHLRTLAQVSGLS